MATFIQTALLFLFATTTICGIAEDMRKLQNERTTILASLSNFDISTQEALNQISNKIHSLLMINTAEQGPEMWYDLLRGAADYQFQSAEDAELTHTLVAERLEAFVRNSFPELDIALKKSDKATLRSNYLQNVPAIFNEVETLMHKEMIAKFWHIVKTPSQKKESVFYGEIITGVLEQIFNELNKFIAFYNDKFTTEESENIQEMGRQASLRLKQLFDKITTLTKFYLNPVSYFKDEALYQIMNTLAATGIPEDLSIERMTEVLDKFGEVASDFKDTDQILLIDQQFFMKYSSLIKGSTSFGASMIGSINSNEHFMKVLRIYLTKVSSFVNPAESFERAQYYMRKFSGYSTNEFFSNFLNDYSRSEQLPVITPIDENNPELTTDHIIVAHFITSGTFHQDLSMWWMATLENLETVFMSKNILEKKEYIKVMFNAYVNPNEKFWNHWKGLFHILNDFVLDNAENMHPGTWPFVFSNFLDQAYEIKDEVKVFYFFWKLEALAFTPNSLNEQEVTFVDFKNNQEQEDKIKDFAKEITPTVPLPEKTNYMHKMLIHLLNSGKSLGVTTKMQSKDWNEKKFIFWYANPQKKLKVDNFYRLNLREEVSDKVAQKLKLVDHGKMDFTPKIKNRDANINLLDVRDKTKSNLDQTITRSNNDNKPVNIPVQPTKQIEIIPERQSENKISTGIKVQSGKKSDVKEEQHDPIVIDNGIDNTPLREPSKKKTSMKKENQEEVDDSIHNNIPQNVDIEEGEVVPKKSEEKQSGHKTIELPILNPLSGQISSQKEVDQVHINNPSTEKDDIIIDEDNTNEEDVSIHSAEKSISPKESSHGSTFSVEEESISKSSSKSSGQKADDENNRNQIPEIDDDEVLPEETPVKVSDIVGDNKDDEEEEEEDQFEDAESQDESEDEGQIITGDGLQNIIEVVKGSLTDQQLENLRNAPDLIEFVESVKVVVDKITGDEIHYHYIQVIDKDSECYKRIHE